MLFAAGASSVLLNIKQHFDRYILQHGPELLANLIAATVILFVGRWVAKLLAKLLAVALKRAKVDETLTKFLVRIAQALMLTVVVIAALGRLGVPTTSLSAILAAAGIAIGMSLQGSLANFAAGVVIIVFRPFKVGDFVEAGSSKGFVEEVHVFHTIMRTPDNVRIIVPNGTITSETISNFSAESTRRIDLVVGCGYGDELPKVKAFLEELLHRDERILQHPAPVVAVDELADSSVNFVVRPWVSTSDYWSTRWDLVEAIKLGFDEHGFQIPFPQQDLHIRQAVAEQPFAEPPRREASQPDAKGPILQPVLTTQVNTSSIDRVASRRSA